MVLPLLTSNSLLVKGIGSKRKWLSIPRNSTPHPFYFHHGEEEEEEKGVTISPFHDLTPSTFSKSRVLHREKMS